MEVVAHLAGETMVPEKTEKVIGWGGWGLARGGRAQSSELNGETTAKKETQAEGVGTRRDRSLTMGDYNPSIRKRVSEWKASDGGRRPEVRNVAQESRV